MVKKVVHVFPDGAEIIERVPPFTKDEELDFYKKTSSVKKIFHRKSKPSKNSKDNDL